MSILGIDLGTSSVKISLADQTGRIIRNSKRDYSVDQPRTDWKEIDPSVWTEAVKDCLLEDFSEQERNSIQSVGVTGQMHTLVILDRQGRPLRKAIMWNDLRSVNEAEELRKKMNSGQKDRSGISEILSSGSPAASLYWMKKNEPKLYSQIGKAMIAPDYIVYWLTGKSVSDYCDLSTSSLMDLNTADYSEKMLDLLQLDRSRLPEIRGIHEESFPVSAKIGEELSLNENCRVYPATGDNAASALGLKIFDSFRPVISIGTSAVVMGCREKPDFEKKGKNILFSLDGRHIQYLVQGSLSSGGSALNWWIQQILNSDFDEILQSKDPECSDGGKVMFFPYLNGDKYVYQNSELRGVFTGLGSRTSRLEMAEAVIEGVAFGIRSLAEEMGINLKQWDWIEVTGGGSTSDLWMQKLSDVLQVSLKAVSEPSSAARGVIDNARIDSECLTEPDHAISAEKVKVCEEKHYHPANRSESERKYRKFLRTMDLMVQLENEEV